MEFLEIDHNLRDILRVQMENIGYWKSWKLEIDNPCEMVYSIQTLND